MYIYVYTYIHIYIHIIYSVTCAKYKACAKSKAWACPKLPRTAKPLRSARARNAFGAAAFGTFRNGLDQTAKNGATYFTTSDSNLQ